MDMDDRMPDAFDILNIFGNYHERVTEMKEYSAFHHIHVNFSHVYLL